MVGILNTFKIEIHAKKDLIIISKELIPFVPDGMFIVIINKFLGMQVTQNQLINRLIMLLINLLITFHQLIGLENILDYKFYL